MEHQKLYSLRPEISDVGSVQFTIYIKVLPLLVLLEKAPDPKYGRLHPPSRLGTMRPAADDRRSPRLGSDDRRSPRIRSDDRASPLLGEDVRPCPHRSAARASAPLQTPAAILRCSAAPGRGVRSAAESRSYPPTASA
jgi:hypothetical protein